MKHKNQHITQGFTWKPNLGKPLVTCYLLFSPFQSDAMLKAYPVKGYNTLLNVTLLKDFYTLSGVCPVRGLESIQLGMSPC